MYNRIVVPVDGSPQAFKALEHAIKLAQTLSSDIRLIVIHVNASFALNEPIFGTELDHHIAAEDKQVLDAAVSKLKAAGVLFQAIHQTGDPATIICDTAADNLADLIVMGSRGLGLVKEMLLGSVSHAVAQHAPCPVLLLK
ncbi:nucleotide-binding universal stress UspA family protein [Paenibacillus cellulosilyticus]|uniref:Nucleotide-binding universal stress UspA family protein n=1 Tax=Paenibacillus cellulosilyticus TaxID=375489 RepID=A0A2V2Z915_9BACL|nr:universal stress protein [Paenibacillus cellulosilyticus]PWW08621.1 nucleotide-binding universal stress UspA family protein [Paenibacillus cellulosilyticus]QKS48189.1 universal stress protein [Paenibacillus cellulosilyticus]